MFEPSEPLPVGVAGFEAIIAAIGDGLTVQDREFRVIYQNRVMKKLFGDQVGHHCYEVYAQGTAVCPDCPVAACFADGKVHSAERSVTINGTPHILENVAAALTDRNNTIIAAVELCHDITRRKNSEQKLIRFSNLYEALSLTNKAIMHLTERDVLFREICRIAVEQGKFSLALIGVVDEETGVLRSVASCGTAARYLDTLTVSADVSREDGLGPTGIAIRERTPYICNDFYADPVTTPWRAYALGNGICASAAFPLYQEGQPFGALKVYSDHKGFFDDDMVSLLEEMAENISFAVDNFSRETQRRNAVEALRISEEQLKLVLEGSNDGFWDWDVATDGVTLSPRYAALLGFLPGGIPASLPGIGELVHPYDRKKFKSIIAAQRSGATSGGEVEIRMRTKSGAWAWMHHKGKVVTCDAAGAPARVAGIAGNVTHRKEIELALHTAKKQAESANQSKSEFLATMSHEIRTPLNGVMGMMQLLRLTGLTDQQADYLNHLETSAQSLLAILNDILDLAKVEAGRIELEPRPFSLRTLLTEVLRNQEGASRVKNLSVSLNISPDVPDALVGDSLRLKQILFNLVGNAIKFTERGSITVSVIELTRETDALTLQCRVTDTGIGIRPEVIEKIFAPFCQGDGSTTREYGGTGLGLTICRRLIVLMGGSIWVDSTEGCGSTFHFTLPLQVGPVEAAQPVPPVEIKVEAPFQRLRILVVEDQAINRLYMVTFLRRLGHQVEAAGNGKEALEMWRTSTPDVILMDLSMPVMDGMTATRNIREQEVQSTDHVTIIALTGHVMDSDKEGYPATGFDGYLAKPVDGDHVLEEITRCLAKTDHSRTLSTTLPEETRE